MPAPLRLGILVPSSNTSLEPLSTALISHLPDITVHFSRFPVTEIALSSAALSQFDDGKILAAASLLADARVDLIGWSGTSAGWLGLDADRRLCRTIEEATGIEATTSVLGLCGVLEEVKRRVGKVRVAFVTPYTEDVQARICETFAAEGYDVVGEDHLGLRVNLDFGAVDEETLDRQMDEVMRKVGDRTGLVVSTFCTNLRAAQRAKHWEGVYPGIVVADTVATVLWQMLRMLRLDVGGLTDDWGKMFEG